MVCWMRTLRSTLFLLLIVFYLLSGTWFLTSSNFYESPYSLPSVNTSLVNRSALLIDLPRFSYKLQAQPCTEQTFIVVIIHSAPQNFEKRNAVRNTWGNKVLANKQSLHFVFLVGESMLENIQKSLMNESLVYGDVVQGSFLDSYRNMTYKHVMGLKWVSQYCPDVQYVLKTDDDIFVDTFQLTQYVKEKFGTFGVSNLIYCYIYSNALVKRSHRSKWYIAVRDYKAAYFPDYCGGWAILYSKDVVLKLIDESTKHRYFWIDDVHVSGNLATSLGIKKVAFNDKFSIVDITKEDENRIKYSPDFVPVLFGYHNIDKNLLYKLWDRVLEYYEKNGYPSHNLKYL